MRAHIFQYFRAPLGLNAVWLASPLFLVALVALASPVRPHDYFWALVQGRAAVQLGAIPRENGFLYTLPADAPFHNQPWLAALTLFGAHELGGHALNLCLLAACLALAFAVALEAALALGASVLPATISALLAVPLVGLGAGVRTQMFAYPCFAFTMYLALSRRPSVDGKSAAVLILLGALWANLHGSFVLAPVLMAAPVAVSLAASLKARRLTPDLLARGARLLCIGFGTLLNPRGPGVYQYVLHLGRAMNVGAQTDVLEWQALSLRSSAGLWFAFTLVASLGLLFAYRRRLEPASALLWVGFGLASLTSQRFLPWFALCGVVAVGPMFPRAEPEPARGLAALNASLLGAFAVTLVLALPGMPLFERLRGDAHLPYANARVLGAETPLGIGEALARAHYTGRLFHDQALGGFLEWMLARDRPRQVAFVDQRFELTPPELWRDYFTIVRAEKGFAGLLRRYGVTAVLVHEARSAALVAALRADPDFRVEARELGYTLFLKKR